MSSDSTIAALTQDFLIPLCQETAHLFRPVRLSKNDRLELSLDKSGKKLHADIYQLVDGVRGYASYEATSRWVDRVPERQKVGGGWSFAATDFTALIINAVWPREQIIFKSQEARLVYDVLLTNFVLQVSTTKAMAEHKLLGKQVLFNLADHPELPLNAYQRQAVMSCYQRSGYAFFMEQGCGKTPPVINRICNEARALREAKPEPSAVYLQTIEAIRKRTALLIEQKCAELRDACEKRCDAKLKELTTAAENLAQSRNVNIQFKGGKFSKAEVDAAIQEMARHYEADMAKAKQQADEFAKANHSACESQCNTTTVALNAAADTEIVSLKDEAPAEQPKKRMYRALIVAPKNVRVNWRNEICRFAITAGKVTVLKGTGLARTKLLIEAFADDPDCEWTVVIASYETVMRSWDAFQMIEWDLCVLDESHFIKSYGAKRTKLMLQMRELCKQRMCLTGTPITNTLFDLWTQLEFLGEGWSGFNSYEAFKKYYGVFVKRGGINKLADYKNVPLIRERLARMAFMITKKEALPNLPDKVYDVYEVTMTAEQCEYYDKIQSQLALEIEADLQRTENRQLVITNVLTKLLRLAQVTSGFISWDPIHSDDGELVQPRTIDRLDPNPKLEALVELLKEKTPDQKTIVWCCWTQDLRSIKARLDLEGIKSVVFYGQTSDAERDEAVKQFNGDPTCTVFIGNTAAGGVGLNLLGYDWWNKEPLLTTNTDHTIFYSQNWSMVTRGQGEDRSHRMGTRVPQRYTDLCVPDTIDEEIRARVLNKKMSALEIQDVRSIMQRVLQTKVSKDD